jgi:predicted molibdopterin-dependent oxidoreductase YjgC
MERFWGLQPGTIYPHAGYDAIRMFDALADDDIQAIWIVGTNPAASMPNLPKIRRAMERAKLVVVQDAYCPTETTRYADVLLPAAVNLEQTGTFCNSERRVTLMSQVVPPPGDARPDWWWPRQIAAAMGFTRGLSFNSAEEIFDEFARSTAGRPNDQSALTHTLLNAKGPQIWPFPALGAAQERRYLDGLFPTPTGRAMFFARQHLEPDERPSAEFPLLLTTGRVANQWHTRTKTSLVPPLNMRQDAEAKVHMHPADAEALFLRQDEAVIVRSARGEASTSVQISAEMTPGLVWMPIHWNDLWRSGASCNEATSDAQDCVSKQPSLKCCAVAVMRRDDAPPMIKQIETGKSKAIPIGVELTA